MFPFVQVNKFIRIRIDFGRHDPDLHWECGYESGSRWARTSHKKVKKFIVLKCWGFFKGAGGFSCRLDVIHEGLGINNVNYIEIFDLNISIFFTVKLYLQF